MLYAIKIVILTLVVLHAWQAFLQDSKKRPTAEGYDSKSKRKFIFWVTLATWFAVRAATVCYYGFELADCLVGNR